MPTPAAPSNGIPEPVRDFFATSGIPLTLADARTGDQPLVLVNAAFCLMSGYSISEVVGRNCRFLQGSEDNTSARKTLRDALAGGRDVQVVLKNARRNGEPFDNLLLIQTLRDRNGQPLFFMGSQFETTGASVASLDGHVSRLESAIERLTRSTKGLTMQSQQLLAQTAVQLVRTRLHHWEQVTSNRKDPN